MKANISEQIINHIKKKKERERTDKNQKRGCESASEELQQGWRCWAEISSQHEAERSQPWLQKGLSTSKGQCSGAWYCCASAGYCLEPPASCTLHLSLGRSSITEAACPEKVSEITRCPISHRSLMTESLMVQKFTSSGTEVTTVYLYHERVAPNLYLKIFFFLLLFIFFFLLTGIYSLT